VSEPRITHNHVTAFPAITSTLLAYHGSPGFTDSREGADLREEVSLVHGQAQDDLALRVEFSRRDESESEVETGRATLAGHIAGE